MARTQHVEVHYFLKDGAHSMNAFIRNKCEAETLAAFKYIADELGFDVVLESSAVSEGSLVEHYRFTLKPESTFLLVGALLVLVQTLISIWNAPPKPDKDRNSPTSTVIAPRSAALPHLT